MSQFTKIEQEHLESYYTAFQFAIQPLIENPYVIIVKAKAVITFGRISNALHVTLFCRVQMKSINGKRLQGPVYVDVIQLQFLSSLLS